MENNKKVYSISNCRICGNEELHPVLDLGSHAMSGVFPKSTNENITEGPLVLVKCSGKNGTCGLVQLQHSYDLAEMYGMNYGYRSGLNQSMVKHLNEKVTSILKKYDFPGKSTVLDIGSNDGTTLNFFNHSNFRRIGFDPTIIKFASYYDSDIELNANFFNLKNFKDNYGELKVEVVTSFSMLYDLENPQEFISDIANILSENGIWVFEQSYMPTMVAQNSYDTVCHEHLEYYSLKQIKWMLDRHNLKIVDVEFNSVNGGSFSVTASPIDSVYKVYENLQQLLDKEIDDGFEELDVYEKFAARVLTSKGLLRSFLLECKEKGLKVGALGASTKGNVILQYCGIDKNLIEFVGEVNEDKFGCFTPGSLIPIIEEKKLIEMNLDFLIILPWHFRSFFESKKFGNSKLVFPLPNFEIS